MASRMASPKREKMASTKWLIDAKDATKARQAGKSHKVVVSETISLIGTKIHIAPNAQSGGGVIGDAPSHSERAMGAKANTPAVMHTERAAAPID